MTTCGGSNTDGGRILKGASGAGVGADPPLAPFPGLASISRLLPTASPLLTDQSRKCYMINAPLGPHGTS